MEDINNIKSEVLNRISRERVLHITVEEGLRAMQDAEPIKDNDLIEVTGDGDDELRS